MPGVGVGVGLGLSGSYAPSGAAAIGTPTFRADTEVVPATATDITFTKPAGTADGDLLVACISFTGVPAVTPPAGWNLILTTLLTASANHMLTYWKIASGEGANYTFSHASATRTGWMGAYSGTRASAPLDGAGTNNQNQASSTNVVATGLTTGFQNDLLIGFWTWAGTRTPTDPGDMDQRYATNGGPGLVVSDLIVPAASTVVPNKTTTLSTATTSGAQLIAFKASGT
jgi:hypothetical protein